MSSSSSSSSDLWKPSLVVKRSDLKKSKAEETMEKAQETIAKAEEMIAQAKTEFLHAWIDLTTQDTQRAQIIEYWKTGQSKVLDSVSQALFLDHATVNYEQVDGLLSIHGGDASQCLEQWKQMEAKGEHFVSVYALATAMMQSSRKS